MDGLPTWMREPLKTDSKEQRMIDCWSLDQQLVEKLGFDNWLPVQLKTIPTILKTEGDVLVSASTGSGKTLCYVLPILNALKNRIVKRTRCLVLVPTKLLVNQVKKQFDDLNLYQLSIVGLGTLSMPQETKLLESGVDIIVATPGRLVDHLQTLELSSLDYLVLDEADRLLAQTYYHIFDKLLLEKQFEPKITEHHQVFPSKTRKLLFSATLTRNPAKLGQLRLFQPVLITNAQDDHRYVVPTTISESYMVVPQPIDKIKALAQYLQEHASPCLVFVKSVQATTRLANVLSKVLNMNVKFLQSDQTPFQRKKIIQGFQEHHIDVIVCSDMSARGIDLTTPLVINYDIPTKTKTYIHRIGRTGRAETKGSCLSLVTENQAKWFKQHLVKNNKIQREQVKKLKYREQESQIDRIVSELQESSESESSDDSDTSSEASVVRQQEPKTETVEQQFASLKDW